MIASGSPVTVKRGPSSDYGLAVIAESEPWPYARVRPRLTFGDQGPERALHEVLLTW